MFYIQEHDMCIHSLKDVRLLYDEPVCCVATQSNDRL